MSTSEPWEPDWMPLPDEPLGDDEEAAKALYYAQTEGYLHPWEELDEWKRQAWRRELRDSPADQTGLRNHRLMTGSAGGPGLQVPVRPILWLFALLTVFPFALLLLTSLKSQPDLLRGAFVLPDRPQPDVHV